MDLAEQARALLRQEMAERPEAEGQVEGAGERQGQGVRPDPVHRRASGGPGEPGPGDVEHAGAEVDAGRPLPAEPAQHADARPGAAADVQAPVERPEGPHRVADGFEHPVRGPVGRAVELRCEQVVSPHGRGERLYGQLAQRGALRSEHRRSAYPRTPRHTA